MKDDYKNKFASKIAARYQDLEERIMQDIVRRIMKAGEITSTADWQINRLRILGYSSEDIEQEISNIFTQFLCHSHALSPAALICSTTAIHLVKREISDISFIPGYPLCYLPVK
jgi:hypothetical protein